MTDYERARDEAALGHWIYASKDINPTDTRTREDFVEFLAKQNKSMTYDAFKAGADWAAFESPLVLKLVEALESVHTVLELETTGYKPNREAFSLKMKVNRALTDWQRAKEESGK